MGLLGHPCAGGVRRNAQNPDAPGDVLKHHKDIDGRAIEQVDGEEVSGQDGLCLRAQELAPGRAGSARYRVVPAFFSVSHTVDGARRMPRPISSL